MTQSTIAVLALLVLGWAAVSGALARHDVTGPFVFAVSGYLLANPDWGPLTVECRRYLRPHRGRGHAGPRAVLRRRQGEPGGAPARPRASPSGCSAIGLVLSVVLGSLLAGWMLAGLPWALAGFVGAALAPTDAALSVRGDQRRAHPPPRYGGRSTSRAGSTTASPRRSWCSCWRWRPASSASSAKACRSRSEPRCASSGGGILTGIGVGIGGALLISTAARHGWIMERCPTARHPGRRRRRVRRRPGLRRQRLPRRLRRRHRLRGEARRAGRRPRGGDRAPLARRRASRADRLVPLRRDPRPPRDRRPRRASRRVRRRQPDGHPHAPGGTQPRALGPRPSQRRVHRMVRSARARLGRVRPAGDRGVGSDRHRGAAGRGHGGLDGALERGAARHHRTSWRAALPAHRARSAAAGTGAAQSTEHLPRPPRHRRRTLTRANRPTTTADEAAATRAARHANAQGLRGDRCGPRPH